MFLIGNAFPFLTWCLTVSILPPGSPGPTDRIWAGRTAEEILVGSELSALLPAICVPDETSLHGLCDGVLLSVASALDQLLLSNANAGKQNGIAKRSCLVQVKQHEIDSECVCLQSRFRSAKPCGSVERNI
jgi:hypothetical protein